MGVRLEMFNRESDGQVFEPGETIFKAGEPGQTMYVVLEGEVELRFGAALRETLGPGEPFGEMALVDHAQRAASAVAITRCKLAPIEERRFLFLVQQTPYFALQMLRVMAERLRKMDSKADAAPVDEASTRLAVAP